MQHDDILEPNSHLDAMQSIVFKMTLNLRVLSPNRVVWYLEVKEVVLSTNSGQIGVLTNHASLVAAIDIGVLYLFTSNPFFSDFVFHYV